MGRPQAGKELQMGSKKYVVRSEYIDSWMGGLVEDWDGIVDFEEIKRLAYEWDRPLDELMEEVEELD